MTIESYRDLRVWQQGIEIGRGHAMMRPDLQSSLDDIVDLLADDVAKEFER